MPEPITAAPSAAPVAPVALVSPETTAPSIETAGAAFKAPGATWEGLGMGGMAVTDGADDALAATAPAVDPAAPDAVADADAPEFVQNAQGQWHRPDGTFANADEIKEIEAQITADAAAVDPAKPTEPETKENVVTLRRRDGTTRDVIVDDPELAQEIRQNMNDGMRKKEFVEKSTALDAKLAELRQIDTLIATNPEAVVLHSLTPEQQISLATSLLAQHFDALIPIIQGFGTNPSARIATTAETQLRLRTQETEFRALTESQARAAAVKGAVASLIPDSLDETTEIAFWQDASADLTRAVARGERVDPSTVPHLLANRMKLYGFEGVAGAQPAAPQTPRISLAPVAPAAAPSAATTPPAAVPVGDAAQALASATAAQRRIRLTQRNRLNAAAVPPVGAGAAPVRMPPVAPGSTIEEASAALKKSRSWTS